MELLTDRLPGMIETFLAHFDDLFKNDVERRGALQYVTGPLMSGSNKTMTEMARHIVQADDQALHHFLTQAPWNPDELNSRRTCPSAARVGGHSFCLALKTTEVTTSVSSP